MRSSSSRSSRRSPRCSRSRRSCGSRIRSCSSSAASPWASRRECRTSSCRPTSFSSSCCRRSSTARPSSPRCATCARTSGRSACSRSGSCSPPRSRSRVVAHEVVELPVGRRVHARRDRLADRPDRRDRDRAPARGAAADRRDHRGRVARQRRHGARRLPRRGRRGRLGLVLALVVPVSASCVGAVGGVLVGLAVGWVVRQARRRLDDPPVEITISLMTGYFAFLPAEVLGVSGVLAAVTAGVYLGWHTPELTTAEVRLQGDAVWEIGTFVLNAVLFVLIGLQLPAILDNLDGTSGWTLLGYGAAIGATVIVVRLLWVFPATYLPRVLSRRIRERDPSPPWQAPALIGWAGMRGAVSLAAALALPFTTDAGTPFPGRDLVIFLAFCVILVTLVGQGLSLPFAIRAARARVGRGGRRAGGGEGAGSTPPRRAWRASTSSRRRAGCARTRPSGCAGCTSFGSAASPRASTTATTARSRSARPTTSGCGASCSRPSERAVRRAAPARPDRRRRDEPDSPRPRPRGDAARSLTKEPITARMAGIVEIRTCIWPDSMRWASWSTSRSSASAARIRASATTSGATPPSRRWTSRPRAAVAAPARAPPRLGLSSG